MHVWADALRAVAAGRPPTIEVKADAADSGAVRIDILGPIGWEGTSAEAFVAALGELRGVTALDVHLSSPGGSAFDGVTIYNNLRSHPAKVRMVIDGLAASAASIIAMAGDDIVMQPGSMMMVHNGRGMVVGGDAEDMRSMSVVLDKTNASMADIYADRAGGTAAGWLEVMAAEQWYTSAEAVAAGLADRVDTTTSAPPPPDDDEDDDEAAVAAWGRSVFGWAYAGREAAPDPKPVPTATESWERAIAEMVAADLRRAQATPPPPDYLAQLGVFLAEPAGASLGLLTPATPGDTARILNASNDGDSYLTALAALASNGKDGSDAAR